MVRTDHSALRCLMGMKDLVGQMAGMLGPFQMEIVHRSGRQHTVADYLSRIPPADHFDYTLPTFNSCTKCMGSLGIINDRMLDCYPVSLAWMYG